MDGRWITFALIGSALTGCGEPVLVTVGVIARAGEATDAGQTTVPKADAADLPLPEDAGLGTSGREDGGDSGNDATPGTDAGCINLIEQASAAGRAAEDPAGIVIAHSTEELGCTMIDAQDPATSSVFERVDGQPILRKGHTYSFRWPVNFVVNRLRLFGGDTMCAVEPITQAVPPLVFGVQAFSLPAPECRTFEAPVDADYLHLAHEYMNYGVSYVTFTLCKSPCPAAP